MLLKAPYSKLGTQRKKVTTNQLQQNLVAFVFEDEDDSNKVMNLSWSFRDLQVIVQRWPPDKSLQEIDMNKAFLWIQAFNIPIVLTNHTTAKLIGNVVGKFIKTDLQSSSQRWKKALRIQVEIDISQPLKSFISLPSHGRPNILIELRYERISDFCFKCGILGHKFQICSANTKEVSMAISTAEFGPWLKAENTHILNPNLNTKATAVSIGNTNTKPDPEMLPDSSSDETNPPNKLAGNTLQLQSEKMIAENKPYVSLSHSPPISDLTTGGLLPGSLTKTESQKSFEKTQKSKALNAQIPFALHSSISYKIEQREKISPQISDSDTCVVTGPQFSNFS